MNDSSKNPDKKYEEKLCNSFDNSCKISESLDEKKEILLEKTVKFKIIVKKIIWLIRYYNRRKKQISKLKENFRPNTQKYFACEYMSIHLFSFVKQGDLLLYCDQRRCKTTNGKYKNYKDNSRGIEILRKDKFPLRWYELKIKNELYFKYVPEKEEYTKNNISNVSSRMSGFTTQIINDKLKKVNYKCQLTGLSVEDGKLAADHWYPKEKGGSSDVDNCVILNKILNEKKNKHYPHIWFSKNILTNFLNISKESNMNMENIKNYLIEFIKEF
jgi:5-methylcytosine-specific restriction endonuclease McrA